MDMAVPQAPQTGAPNGVGKSLASAMSDQHQHAHAQHDASMGNAMDVDDSITYVEGSHAGDDAVSSQLHENAKGGAASQSQQGAAQAPLSTQEAAAYVPPPTDEPGAPMLAAAVPAPANAARVYLATYSSVPVYELTVRGIAVMRRREDAYLNATQILKVAGIEKGRRTKILEKDIITGEHEKVQGGYGKYQGTWIPLKRAQELSAQYNVAHLLKPILEFDPANAGSLTTAPKGKRPNPNAPSAQRLVSSRPSAASGSVAAPTSSSAVSVADDSAAPEGSTSNSLRPSPSVVTMENGAVAQAGAAGAPSQAPRFLRLRPPPPTGAINDLTPAALEAGTAVKPAGQDGTPADRSPADSNAFTPNKRARFTGPGDDAAADGMQVDGAGDAHHLVQPSPVRDLNNLGPAGGSLRAAARGSQSGTPGSAAAARDAQLQAARSARVILGPPDHLAKSADLADSAAGARYADRAQAFKGADEAQERLLKEILTGLFLDESDAPAAAADKEDGHQPNYEAELKQLLGRMSASISLGHASGSAPAQGNPENPNVSVNIVIDDHGHTPLHWAAALSKLSLLRMLLARPASQGGANLHAGNYAGETALHRSVLVTNSYEAGTFAHVLNLLAPSIQTRDYKKRTILHHIAMVAALKGRAAPARYYLATVLEHLAAAQRPASSSSSAEEGAAPAPAPMSRRDAQALIDAQDESGETALGIVARIGNASMIRMLMEVGARKDVPNHFGIRPSDWGLEHHLVASALTNRKQEQLLQQADQAQAQAQTQADDDETAKVAGELASSRPSEVVTALAKPPPGPIDKSENVLSAIQMALEEVKQVYEAEMAGKQQKLAAAQTQLRQATHSLASRRKEVSDLQAKVAQRDELRQSIANLERALQEFRNVPDVDEQRVEQQVAALHVPGNSTNAEIVRLRWLYSWLRASSSKLEARIEAIEQQAKTTEEQCRKVVAMCCGVEEERVESILDDLVVAIESDGADMDLSRVAGFLSKAGPRAGAAPPPPPAAAAPSSS